MATTRAASKREAKAAALAVTETAAPQAEAHDRARAAGLPMGSGRGLGMAMLRAREVVMRGVRPVLRRHGLTDQQWRILRSLDAKSPLSPSSLSTFTTILLPSLLRILTAMEEGGLIRQERTQSGGRVSVSLTPRGQAMVAEIHPQITTAQTHLAQYLTRAEMEVLRALLMKLYAREDED